MRSCRIIMSPPPLAGGGWGEGENQAEYTEFSIGDSHPHPSPPPSRGRGFCFETDSGYLLLLVVAFLLSLALAGCDKKPPEAPPSLPRVERPVLALDVKPGATLRIKIPRAVLVERGGVPGVFVLSEAGEARFRLVRPGRTGDAQVEILSGLHGTETLVLGDLAAVHDGTPITMKQDIRR